MRLTYGAVGERVLAPDMLPRDPGPAPYARVLQRVREILVHQPRDVLHRLPAAQRERPVLLRRLAGSLGVYAHDAEMPEEPGSNFSESLPGFRRNRERGVVQPRQLQ